jgi:hypothetical protein
MKCSTQWNEMWIFFLDDFTPLIPQFVYRLQKSRYGMIERLHSIDYDKWARESCALQRCMMLAFFAPCASLCWMEQGVKLLNNRNLYHLDDFKSIIFVFFLSFSCCFAS